MTQIATCALEITRANEVRNPGYTSNLMFFRNDFAVLKPNVATVRHDESGRGCY